MAAEKDWATFQLKEAPFWRDGMTPEEYDKEREYLYKHHWDDYTKGLYLPLWVQDSGEEAADKWKNRIRVVGEMAN